jgi:hypothetical protein
MKLLPLLFLGFTLKVLAQPTDLNQVENGKYAPYLGKPFILFENADTLFCSKVELGMKGQEVDNVVYYVEGEKKILRGKEVQQLQAFYAENRCLMELMPLKPEKPDGKRIHLFKNVVGHFTVWTNNHQALVGLQLMAWGSSPQPFHSTVQMVSIEGGPVFRADMRSYRERIDPLLVSCEGIQSHSVHFSAEPGGFLDFNFMELADKCFDYNRLCAPNYR